MFQWRGERRYDESRATDGRPRGHLFVVGTEPMGVNRRLGYASLVGALALGAAAGVIRRFGVEPVSGEVGGVAAAGLLAQALLVAAVGLAAAGGYVLVLEALLARTDDKRRKHDLRNVVRLAFIAVAVVGVLGVLTRQYVGVLFSLGIVGFAVTFALQQPLFSLIGWLYIMVSRPYGVGDRVAIEGSKGDVVEVDFFVTIRLRYLVHTREGQRVRNDLYERILARMNEHPDRVAFPVSRNR